MRPDGNLNLRLNYPFNIFLTPQFLFFFSSDCKFSSPVSPAKDLADPLVSLCVLQPPQRERQHHWAFSLPATVSTFCSCSFPSGIWFCCGLSLIKMDEVGREHGSRLESPRSPQTRLLMLGSPASRSQTHDPSGQCENEPGSSNKCWQWQMCCLTHGFNVLSFFKRCCQVWTSF